MTNGSWTPSTPVLVGAGVVAGALVLWPVLTWAQVQKLEKPKYEILKSFGKVKGAAGIEIRQYAPYLIAEVTVEGEDMKEALGMGFRQIANFIFGNNAAPGSGKSESVSMTSPVILKEGKDQPASMKGGDGEKIAMTTPVATEMSDGRYSVSFVMPSKYTKDSLPTPKTDSVTIKEIPAHTLAALTWRGASPGQPLVQKKKQILIDALLQHGIKADPGAKARLYQYYPPWTPFWLRTQDVLLPVEFDGGEQPKKGDMMLRLVLNSVIRQSLSVQCNVEPAVNADCNISTMPSSWSSFASLYQQRIITFSLMSHQMCWWLCVDV